MKLGIYWYIDILKFLIIKKLKIKEGGIVMKNMLLGSVYFFVI